MEYVLLFLEGILTFISPCLLPMLPIYISYFAGQDGDGDVKSNQTLKNAVGFVLGFTVVFVALGAFAGTLGNFLKDYQIYINIISGLIMIIFGLNIIGVLNFSMPKGNINKKNKRPVGFIGCAVFGFIFSIGWTPCVSAFLGSALIIAAQSGEVLKGITMLLVFSLGLGVPFILSAVLIKQLKSTFDFIKKNYKVIQMVSGSLLIIMGILTAIGFINRFLLLLV